jgi:type II secretory pathway pseudopilin PulG
MTATIVAIAIVAALGAGFGAGWGLKPDGAAKALEAQAATLEALQEGQARVLEQAGKPLVIDAELRSTLAEVPVQCRSDAGGSPKAVECQWATCLQYGQSSAQRPECRAVEQLMIDGLKGEICKP